MPRKPRFVLPGQPHHVVIRGVNRQAIFLQEADYRYCLKRLREAFQKHGCDLHAYVLMTNHIHLLMTPENEQGISKSVQTFGRYYVRYFNKSYKRSGTLWEGRFKSTLVDTERYLLTCYRYIELNPVRANIVTQPMAYPWSSYHHNATGKANDLITPHERYNALGTSIAERQAAYTALFNKAIEFEELYEIRFATNREWVLGRSCFRKAIEQKLKRKTAPQPRGGDRKSSQFRARRRINRH